MRSYISLLKALKIEANSNQLILENSFKTNYLIRIVYRKFDYELCANLLNNKTFLNEAPDTLVNIITNYNLELKRANEFRESNNYYRYHPELDKRWGDTLRMAWTNSLANCSVQILTLRKILDRLK